MDQSARNERRAVSAPQRPAQKLAQMAFRAARDVRLKLLAGSELTELLDALGRYVDDIEERLRFVEAGVRPPELPAQFEQQLYGLLSIGAAEQQLEPPVSDSARPGGIRPGDEPI